MIARESLSPAGLPAGVPDRDFHSSAGMHKHLDLPLADLGDLFWGMRAGRGRACGGWADPGPV